MRTDAHVTIIGGGVVGTAIAYQLSAKGINDIVLIDRNPRIPGENQSSRNSGVVHAGIYYPQNKMPLKAKLCVEGNRMLFDFCRDQGIPSKQTGKLVVATVPQDELYLEDVLHIARENNVPGVRQLSGSEARDMEPNVRARLAVYVPTSGIVEPSLLVKKLHQLSKDNGVAFLHGHEATQVHPQKDGVEITVRMGGEEYGFTTEVLINAAGLHSDRIGKMINPKCPYEMNLRRGESAKFTQSTRPGLNMRGMNVYPVPHGIDQEGHKLDMPFAEFDALFQQDAVKKTVGVHLTPTFTLTDGAYGIGHEVTIGPITVGHVGRDDLAPSAAPAAFLDKVKAFFPELTLNDITLHQTGVMSQLKGCPDFVIGKDPVFSHCINLIGIDSPGLTASLAIAKHVGDLLGYN